MTLPLPSAARRIVIVGGGAGVLELATRIGRRRGALGAEIILVDRAPTHLWKPRLHEVAVGLIGSGDDETSYLAHAGASGYTFHLGELVGIDPTQKVIRLASVKSRNSEDEILPEREIAYDTLVLAFGSRVHDFGIAGVREHRYLESVILIRFINQEPSNLLQGIINLHLE